MPGEPDFLTIAEAAALIKARKLSPVELTRSLLARLESLDGHIHSFITLTADLALEQATRAETEITAGHYRGPLHGIPIGIKDIYQTAGILTTGNSRVCRDFIPRSDAAAVARLKAAGAILMGKQTAHEFAHGGPSFDLPWPPARNPWNTRYFTGGSSSGSAAAIAAGFVLGSLGSDTGGSIRGPACLSGIAGLKPTFGLVSRAGVMPNSFSLDHCGPMAWTVEDCAMMLEAIAGYDPADPASAARPLPDYRSTLGAGLRGLTIGVIRHFWENDLVANDELARATEAAIEVLSGLGARIEDCRMSSLQVYRDVKMVIGESELFGIHHQDLRERPGEFGADFLGRTLPACLFQAADYVQAQRERRVLVADMAPLYDRYDALVTAGVGPAPLLAPNSTVEFWKKPNVTTPFNVTGSPALSLCCGFSSGGLPIGLQIAGRPFEDATVLRVGHAYERETPWRARRPVISRESGLDPTGAPATISPEPDPATYTLAVNAAKQAGLSLNSQQLAQICEAAPHALEFARRLRRDRPRSDEPASVFMAPSPENP